MEWHITDAQSLAIIDQEFGEHSFSPAEYEIVRQVIYVTADFDYKHLVRFSEQALQAGATALATRATIIVDTPTVQAAIFAQICDTFANPIYCGVEAITRPQKGKTQAAWGIETLAKRYPEAIFVIGESQPALATLVDLIENGDARPALVIGTPTGFVDIDVLKSRLNDALIPNIRVDGRKGSAIAAAAIFNSLVRLSWQAYGSQ
ncbi:precorrin-8X methylmutase [Pseudanabaena sp. FACHB-1277]|jgi:precorrin-8X/cobalt-precorrin-8 methylmutase|uniref:Precorrin-8X methylmutase n=1 Tax=Pseudanabaena cinerea FACHB-1277 TaxID=2949581 RepID=A0A926Z6D1_9CYAN|nr:precorrin-8X methylmutase [Pseudanabaena cinerea]MBD2148579.1 precorrin-8X methylmutase [Pseudanabaena cinerea FACHB-1277]